MIYHAACVFSRPTMPFCGNPPAPGSGEHYMISQELARRYTQHHPHGRPAEQKAGTTSSPWEMGTIYHLPGAGYNTRVQRADHPTFINSQLLEAGDHYMISQGLAVRSACWTHLTNKYHASP
ncbi:hypothetical protein N7445_004966 [Penicillium cf. griseofulvum]|nr:hypothetical protein N7445_004966 [Penicillium cf. griseofulvum]